MTVSYDSAIEEHLRFTPKTCKKTEKTIFMYLVSVFVDRNLYVIATVDSSWIYLTVAFPLLIKYFMIFEKNIYFSPISYI